MTIQELLLEMLISGGYILLVIVTFFSTGAYFANFVQAFRGEIELKVGPVILHCLFNCFLWLFITWLIFER